MDKMKWIRALAVQVSLGLAAVGVADATTLKPNDVKVYPDGRPVCDFRLEAKDSGAVLKHNDGTCPGDCDKYGARDVWTWEYNHTYYMHYDASGDLGWLTGLAVSQDMITWEKKGTRLDLGAAGKEDSKSASYGLPFFDGTEWHMFYLGTPNTTPAPDRIPGFPYLTLKAKSVSPEGPWTKQYDVTPFRPQPGTYYSVTASPGYILDRQGTYRMYFAAGDQALRTLSIARTTNLNGPWTVDTKPILPPVEQIENSYLHYEKTYDTWFLFTNHVGVTSFEYTDAVWVYWSRDPDHWDAANKAVVMDPKNCTWAKGAIGLPALLERNGRLALFYDAAAGESYSHMGRDIGMAWLNLPLVPMYNYARATISSPKATVRASSVLPPWSLESLVDGDRTGASWDQGGGWNDSTNNGFPDWVEIEFDKPRAIQMVNIFTLQDGYATAKSPVTLATPALLYGIRNFSLQAWNGSAWTDIPGGSVLANDKAWRQFSFPPITTNKIRVTVDDAKQGYSRLVELEAWGTPILGCTDVQSAHYNVQAEVDDGTCTGVGIGKRFRVTKELPGPLASESIGVFSGGFNVKVQQGKTYMVKIQDRQGRTVAALQGNGPQSFPWTRPGVFLIEVKGDGIDMAKLKVSALNVP